MLTPPTISPPKPQLILRTKSQSSSTGRLVDGIYSWPCVIGKNGLRTRKREGDLATPVGHWPILWVYYRPDRVPKPKTALPIQAIRANDGWCDAIGDRNYNRPVTLPYPASCETLWREDHAYDLCIVLNYNMMPRKRGLGSAVFFHLTQDDRRPTEGCIAVDYLHMQLILQRLTSKSIINIL